MGYAEGTPGCRVWDPETHQVWNVSEPGFDEQAAAGWWRKPVAVKQNVGDDEDEVHRTRTLPMTSGSTLCTR